MAEAVEKSQCPNPATVEKYSKAVSLYAGTQIPIREICEQCGVTVNGFNGYIRRYRRDLLSVRDGVPHYRQKGTKSETEAKYSEAVRLYADHQLSIREICARCGVTVNGLTSYISRYHRHLLLERNGVKCDGEEAATVKVPSFQRQKPATHAKYKAAIRACDSMEYIEYNISEIARMFGLEGTNLGRQLRTHYPEILEFRERARHRLGVNDNLPRGTRPYCTEQYAEAVKLLQSDRYLTVQEVSERCNVSYAGLVQHLRFYHKELVAKRIATREKAIRQQRKGKITGRGTASAPKPETVEKYAEALRLYRTTSQSASRIAKATHVSRHGFLDYLQRWHKELICERRNISYNEEMPVDWSLTRKYNPATAEKYAEAIRRLKESCLTTAAVAAEFGLQPEAFRCYLKEHEPELHARLGMVKTPGDRWVSRRSMEKYAEAVHLYGTTTEGLRSLARRFGVNDCSLGQFIKRHFPELNEQHQKLVQQQNYNEKNTNMPVTDMTN